MTDHGQGALRATPDEETVTGLAALGERVADLIDALESHADPAVRTQVEELLTSIDSLHRHGLTRLAGLLDHHQLLGHAREEPVIELLLDLYELGAAAEPPPTIAAGDLATPPRPVSPAAAARHPDGRIGLADIKRFTASSPAPLPHRVPAPVAITRPAGPRNPVGTASGVAGRVPAGSGDRPLANDAGVRPVAAAGVIPGDADEAGWTELPGLAGLEPETMATSADGQVLVCRVGATLHALRNRCGESPLPLHFGELTGGRVVCAWHKQCAYDPQSGESSSGRRTIVYPVITEDGVVRVALGLGGSTGPLQPQQLRASPL